VKRLTLVLIILFFAVASLLALPATDARFLNIEISYRLQNDGSWDMDYSHQVRLDTYYAVNRALGETFIVYNPDFQKLEVLKAETTMADGRRVAAPANAFNEVLPFAAHAFADFAHLREMVVTHPGLERGSTVDLHYRVHTRAGFFPVFSGREALFRDFPIDRYSLAIVVPAGLEMSCRVFGLKTAVQASVDGAEKRYVLTRNAVPAAVHEPLPAAQAEPFIVFSCARDWRQALALANDDSRLPAAMALQIDKLKAQCPARPDLLAALQKLTAVEIQNCNLGADATGWQPRPLERVAASNYGTRLEKALLLQAMLKQAGFAGELLAVGAGAELAAEVPGALSFAEYWLKVVDGRDTAYLDPWREQNEYFPYRCQGFDLFNLGLWQTEKFPAADWERSGVDVSGAAVLDPAGVSGTLTVTARGIFNRYHEAVVDNGAFISGLLKKIFPVDKVEVKKLLALTRGEMRVEATFSGKWLKDAGAGLYTLDACRLPGVSESMAQLARRETPLALEAPFKISLELDLQLASGLGFEYGIPDVEVRNEAGYFSRSLSPEKDGHIRFSEACGIEKTLLAPEQYPLLRDLLMPYFAPDFWLVLKKSN
jgi:hypothetical protein